LLADSVLFNDENTARFNSFLDAASCLTEITFRGRRSVIEETDSALSRHTSIQTLRLEHCHDDFVLPIIQKLASAESTSRLKKLAYEPIGGRPSVVVVGALQQYLQSAAGASIQSVELVGCEFFRGFLTFLTKSTTVNEVVFSNCPLAAAQQVAKLVRLKPNLQSLRLSGCSFFGSQQFADAMIELVKRRPSPLRSFHIDVSVFGTVACPHISYTTLQTFMMALASYTQLEFLHIEGINFFQYSTRKVIALIQAKALSLTMNPEARASGLDEAEILLYYVKTNYHIQRVHCTGAGSEENWLSVANQARLEFYLDRNRKLARWTEDPDLVPHELWSYAVMLALKAGRDSLYRSLLALGRSRVGLRERNRL